MTRIEAHKWYAKTSKRIRQGDDSQEAFEENRQAEAAYRAFLPEQEQVKDGWYNLPIAKTCWSYDAQFIER